MKHEDRTRRDCCYYATSARARQGFISRDFFRRGEFVPSSSRSFVFVGLIFPRYYKHRRTGSYRHTSSWPPRAAQWSAVLPSPLPRLGHALPGFNPHSFSKYLRQAIGREFHVNARGFPAPFITPKDTKRRKNPAMCPNQTTWDNGLPKITLR